MDVVGQVVQWVMAVPSVTDAVAGPGTVDGAIALTVMIVLLLAGVAGGYLLRRRRSR